MERLLEGYRRFRQAEWPERRRLFEILADDGQQPRAMVVACADSRADPGMIFDAGPGELFVVRNVANIVPPYTPDSAHHGTCAALEFGVRVLKVTDLVVMGHALCGGLQALLGGSPSQAVDFMPHWISIAGRAKQRALVCDDPAERQLRCEQETVQLSLDHLMTFPWIADRVNVGLLRLHGMHFDIRSGLLTRLREDGRFVAVEAA